MKQAFFVLASLLSASLYGQEVYTITDPRDGEIYKVADFKIPLEGGIEVTRTWMVDNLRFEANNSYCYANEPAYCEKFGRLYTAEAAKDACPDGWKIPTRKDWFQLFSIYGGVAKAGASLREGGSSPMNILLAGLSFGKEHFKRVGSEGDYWYVYESETPNGIVTFYANSDIIKYGDNGDKYENSCRCIKVRE